MEYAIKREYNHKTFGPIDAVALVAKIDSVMVNGTELPSDSVEYLLRFSLQSLQDAYAGAKTEAEAKEFFGKKLKNLLAGEIGSRGPGNAVSEETQVSRILMRANYTATFKDDAARKAEWKEWTEEQKVAHLDKLIAKNSDVKDWTDSVAAEMKRRAAEKAKIAAMSKTLVLEL